MREDVEQIDELSKKTTDAYATKATKQIPQMDARIGGLLDDAAEDQHRGMQYGEPGRLNQGVYRLGLADKLQKKRDKRLEGVLRAKNRLITRLS